MDREDEQKMRRLLQEAVDFAGVPPDKMARFSQDLRRSWKAGEFNANVGAAIATLEQYRQVYGADAGSEPPKD